MQRHALSILDDPEKLFAASRFVDLEVLPKAQIGAVTYAAAAADKSQLKHVVALGSNTIEAADVPRQFWQQIGDRLPASPILYAGPRGTWQEIEIPRLR